MRVLLPALFLLQLAGVFWDIKCIVMLMLALLPSLLGHGLHWWLHDSLDYLRVICFAITLMCIALL